nr:hypothetical protein CFP56_79184 [Quercus suber]
MRGSASTCNQTSLAIEELDSATPQQVPREPTECGRVAGITCPGYIHDCQCTVCRHNRLQSSRAMIRMVLHGAVRSKRCQNGTNVNSVGLTTGPRTSNSLVEEILKCIGYPGRLEKDRGSPVTLPCDTLHQRMGPDYVKRHSPTTIIAPRQSHVLSLPGEIEATRGELRHQNFAKLQPRSYSALLLTT